MPRLAQNIGVNPTPDQVTYVKQAWGTTRLVWNWALPAWRRQWLVSENPNAGALKRQCDAIQYTAFPWLKNIHRDAESQPFADRATAWQRLWTQIQRRVFKKARKPGDSFYVTHDILCWPGAKVKRPKIGWGG